MSVINLGYQIQGIYPELEAGVDFIILEEDEHGHEKGAFIAGWNATHLAIPTEAELLAVDITERIAIEGRRAAYPSTGDQFDMQYHDSVDGTTTWADAIAAVKTKYPKS